MNRRPYRRFIALLLGVLMGLGMTLSTIEAANMQTKMSMSLAMSAPGHNGCNNRDSDMNGGGSGSMCQARCITSLAAIMPSVDGAVALQAVSVASSAFAIPHGRIFSPDPHPPKSSDL